MKKKSIDDFALFGGTPLFKESLHVGRPNLGNREKFLDRVNTLWEGKWLTNAGPYVRDFESQIAKYVGVKHCIATCNGTIALELVARAMGLKGEVIVPSFTFVATANALQWQAITPVFCDIEEQNYTIDPERIEQLITPRTRGIIGVHLWGRSCDINTLTDIAERHNLGLLFDASHAFGVTYRGQSIGQFGDAEVFSFHATKFLNSFEGGAVVTNSDELARKLRLMKNFGFTATDKADYLGINGKMSEVQAAMGLTSLESVDSFISINRENYTRYQKMLEPVPGIEVMPFSGKEKHNYQYISLDIDDALTGIERDCIMRVLHAERIRARRYFYPGCHNMEPYRSYFPNAKLLLPVTERVMRRVLCLPTGTSIGRDTVHTICDLIADVVTHGKEIRQRIENMGLLNSNPGNCDQRAVKQVESL